MSDGRMHLKSFAAGKTLRLFQAGTGEVYEVQQYDKSSKKVEYRPEQIPCYYFMKGKKSMRVLDCFTPGFKESLRAATSDEKSEVYYNEMPVRT